MDHVITRVPGAKICMTNQGIKRIPLTNADDSEGEWITINGTHILLKDGESTSDAFNRTTGKDLDPSTADVGRFVPGMGYVMERGPKTLEEHDKRVREILRKADEDIKAGRVKPLNPDKWDEELRGAPFSRKWEDVSDF